jgi:predicted  nucleic acid-binding Zn-ribbon protein
VSTEAIPASHEPLRGLDRLLELQDLDLSIDRLQRRLNELEAQGELQALRGRLAGLESQLGEVRLSIDEVETAQRRLENDIESMELKIEAERKRLYDGSVANAKELQSIEAEVQSLRGRKSRKEDEILDLMERREELDARARPIDGDLKEARQRVAEIEEGSARELVEVETALRNRWAERDALLPAFDEELLGMYEDLRRQKNGVAAAALVDGVCQGCHQQLSPVFLDRMKRSEGLQRCEHCRRILIPA